MKLLDSDISNLTSIFIVGPTASGKSKLAMDLAQKIGGEIVCADSQTIRKHLTIGTAKPTIEDRRFVAHHLLDIIEPYASFSVAEYARLAREAIADIRSRGKVPIVVGGSGLYIDALFFGYGFTKPESNEDFSRFSIQELQEQIRMRGLPMPKNETNPRHLIGVLRRGGAEHENDRTEPVAGAVAIGLRWPADVLKQRIAERIDHMFETGFLEEVRELVDRFGEPPHSIDAIGYPIAMRYLKSEISLDEAKELFRRGDWYYVKKQLAWFKRNRYIHWLDPGEHTVEKCLELLEQA